MLGKDKSLVSILPFAHEKQFSAIYTVEEAICTKRLQTDGYRTIALAHSVLE